jgi:hypothetical protein
MRWLLPISFGVLFAISLVGRALAQALPCDPEAYGHLEEAIAGLDGERVEPLLEFIGPDGQPFPTAPPEAPVTARFDFAAAAVGEACALPEHMKRTLEAIVMAPPDPHFHLQIVVYGLTQDLGSLVAACGGGGPEMLARAGVMASPEREAAFVGGCEVLAELDREESLVVVPLERLLTAAVVYTWLRDQGEPHAQALGRLLLGFGLTTWMAP